MPPAPDCHFADAEDTRRPGVAAKHHLKQEVVLAAAQTAFEARFELLHGNVSAFLNLGYPSQNARTKFAAGLFCLSH
jgi:hypothetical protein